MAEPAIDEWIIEHVLAGQISPEEASERLGIPVGSVLRATRERARAEEEEKPRGAPIDEESSERLSENWEKAREGAEIEPEPLPPLEAAIQSFPPARWLLGTERRRLATMVAVCAVAGAGVVIMSAIRKDAEPAEKGEEVVPIVPPADRAAAALEVAKSFVATKTWQERLAYVRNADATSELMKEWYETRGEPFLVLEEPQFWRQTSTFIGQAPYLIFEARLPDDEPLLVPLDMSGEVPKIDWEAHVHYQPISWEMYRKQRPSEPMAFRVEAAKSDYFPPPFDDAARYMSVELTSPLGIVGLNGFVEKNGRVGLLMQNFLVGNEQKVRSTKNLILTLRFPEDTASPAVEIVGAIEGWIRH